MYFITSEYLILCIQGYTRPHFPAYCQATLHISTACRKAFFLLLSFAKLALNVYLITTLQNGDVFNSSLERILNPSLSLLFLMCQVLSNSISCSNSSAIDKDNVYLTNHRLRRVFLPNIFSISWRIAPAWKGTLFLYLPMEPASQAERLKDTFTAVLASPPVWPTCARVTLWPRSAPTNTIWWTCNSCEVSGHILRVHRKFHCYCCHSWLPTFSCCKTFEIQQAADHAKLPVPDWHNVVAICI